MNRTKTVYRKDYRAFTHRIESVELDFVLAPESSIVKSTMKVTPLPNAGTADLVLDADSIEFVSVSLNGQSLNEANYELTDKSLTIRNVCDPCTIDIVNRFNAAANTALSGIYMSHGAFMSQCESEGFRRITYWPDRPDVMSRFTVTIHADKETYPVLLSNGNLVDFGDEDDGKHWTRWIDPFNKPSYLFALVAGDFVERSETIKLKNGKESLLQVWTERQNHEKSAHALESLKKAIRWDEERFGLELDLDRFMIVATDDFNFGAMENKGLNIFNSRYVMATPTMATDADYDAIESVVGHEYFHNWTGNRITLRDWFQLTLKEGLTVFRDQEFSMDMAPDESARAVKRIQDVRALRARQFPEDAGPMAHPIRPDSYQEINNFYTMTVYEKGAEVIRMLQTILGKDGFRQGMDEYVRRHDGKAVTCDDFIQAMADANHMDLTQFALWWTQAGTPRVSFETDYDAEARTFTLRATQSTPATPGQNTKRPMWIPITIGLLDKHGNDLALQLKDHDQNDGQTSRTLMLTEESMAWTFTNIDHAPVVSIGRGFSAPVIFDYPYTRDELAFLACHDSDPFNRAEALHRLALDVLGEMVDQAECGHDPVVPESWLNTFGTLLNNDSLSPAFRATALSIPSESTIGQSRSMINPSTIHLARKKMIATIGQRFDTDLSTQIHKNLTLGTYRPNAVDAGKRMLKNLALEFWLAAGSPKALLAARDQFDHSDNLTDKLAALQCIVNSPSPAKLEVLNMAASQWVHDPLLMNKWFTAQAVALTHPNECPLVERIRTLMSFDVFSLTNPNNVYALVYAFMTRNESEFHREDGSGYRFWEEMVLQLDQVNPHVAARVARALDGWRRYEPMRARMMHNALEKISHEPNLSRAVREIVEKALNNN